MIEDKDSKAKTYLANLFGLYLHFPYCVHRCSYCDFFSLTGSSESDRVSVLSYIARESSNVHAWLAREGKLPPPATSIFMGGGTPSLFPVQAVAETLRDVVRLFPVDENCEITLEANPENVSVEWVRSILESTPVNRLSLGVQSFSLRHLKTLERLATPDSVRRAVSAIKEAGIADFSLDLIFGIPQQTAEEILGDIDQAADLGPNHISWYNLTLKPGHKLFDFLPDEDRCADFYELGRRHLEKRGYVQYEVSNFSRPGAHSRHNLLYWSGADFLGLGPSAASRFFWGGKFHHRKAPSNLDAYQRMSSSSEMKWEVSTKEQTALEAIFLELRKNSGIRMADFESRYGFALSRSPRLGKWIEAQALEIQEGTLRFTDTGRLIADTIAVDL